MDLNGVTEYLRLRCAEREKRYYELINQEREHTGRSLLFVKRSFYDEMEYKLLSLVDGDFGSFSGYLEQVRALVPVHRSYTLRNELDPEALALLREAEEEFLNILSRVKETDCARARSYCRVILGQEREELEYAILEKWNYTADYWYPLRGDFDEHKLFLNMEHLEPYWEGLCRLLGLPGMRLYEYGESFFDDGQLAQVDEIYGYGGNEVAYLPKDLSWIIYFSHEDTVTFAGSILPMVKELLAPVREHWNSWN